MFSPTVDKHSFADSSELLQGHPSKCRHRAPAVGLLHLAHRFVSFLLGVWRYAIALLLCLGTAIGVAAQNEFKKDEPSYEIAKPGVLLDREPAPPDSEIRMQKWPSLPGATAVTIRSAEILPCSSQQARCGYLGSAWDIWKVRVRLDVDGEPEEYRVSETIGALDAPWRPFTSDFVYTLSSGLGEKTLHIQVRGKKARFNNKIMRNGGSVAPRERESSQEVSASGHNGPGGLAAVEVDSGQLRADALSVQSAELSVTYRVSGTIRIVSLGESYAAGEGAPDLGTGDARTTRWQSQQCHRSVRNGRTMAVAELQEAFGDNVTILYRDFACSGASINLGLLGPFAGLPDLNGQVQAAAPSQIEEAREWLGDNRLDILFLSVGGNDVGFAEAITTCISPAAKPWGCGEDEKLRSLVADGDPANATAKIGFRNLPEAYARLDRVIDQSLNPRHVLIAEYPDPTRNENGETCGCKSRFLTEGAKESLTAFFERNSREVLSGYPWRLEIGSQFDYLETAAREFASEYDERTAVYDCYDDNFYVRPEHVGFWQDPYGELQVFEPKHGPSIGASASNLWDLETRWIRENILDALNEEMQRAAQRNGWLYVGGIAEATRLHGLCASPGERWFNTLRDSWENQGDIYGSVHPNDQGHLAYKDAILESLKDVLRD